MLKFISWSDKDVFKFLAKKSTNTLFCQFLKFVKKIGDGEIVIKDNEVIEKTPEDKAEVWAQEFSTAPQVLLTCSSYLWLVLACVSV